MESIPAGLFSFTFLSIGEGDRPHFKVSSSTDIEFVLGTSIHEQSISRAASASRGKEGDAAVEPGGKAAVLQGIQQVLQEVPTNQRDGMDSVSCTLSA